MIFDHCSNSPLVDIQQCLHKSLVPLFITIGIIFLKIVCLRGQRIILWSSFLICFIAQMWILKHIIGHFQNNKQLPGASANLTDWLMFTPTMIMALGIDFQFTQQVRNYKPIAFVGLPHEVCRWIGGTFALVSFLTTIAAIVLSFMTFAHQIPEVPYIWIYDVFIIKSITWSPFIGWEYYELLFEHLYYDTQYQLNQIRPGEDFLSSLQGVKATSPRIAAVVVLEDNAVGHGASTAGTVKTHFVNFET